MDENKKNSSGMSEKEHTEQNAKEGVKAIEKGAALYAAGPEGVAAVNAVHNAPVIGKVADHIVDREAKKLAKNPFASAAMNKLGDSGITNKLNKGMDTVGAVGGGGAGGATGAAGAATKGASGAANAAGASSKATSAAKGVNDTLGKLPSGSNAPDGGNDNQDDEEEDENNQDDNQEVDDDRSPSQKVEDSVAKAGQVIKFIWPALPYIGGLLVTILVVMMVMAEIMVIRDKIVTVVNEVIKTEQKLLNFVTGEGWNTEDSAFFIKLNEAYINFNQSSEENLDIPLIAATIHYSKVTDMNNWDGSEEAHNDDVGKNESNYSDSQDSGIGSSIVETFQTWSFYQMAGVKLGSSATLIPGQRGLLGHLIQTSVKWNRVCITKALGEWSDFFNDIFNVTTLEDAIEANKGSVGAGLLQKVSDFIALGPLGMIGGIDNFIADISAFEAQDSSLLDWWSANVIYEAKELAEFFTKNYDDARLVAASYSYYNNLTGSGTKPKTISNGAAEYTEAANSGKPTEDEKGFCLLYVYTPEAVRTMDYKGYYRYLVNVYIPVTYYRGLKLDEDYTFLEVVNTANAIFDQKYLYEYLVGKDTENLASGCGYTFSGGSSAQVSVDKNMIDNLYVNVLSPRCSGNRTTCSDIEETVSLKDYVIGVVYREIGASLDDNVEYLKANIIAAKSYTVGRRSSTQNGDKYYIKMENSTNDQVYCSVTKGCMSASSNRKLAPSAELLEFLGKLYDEVYNEFLYSSKDKTFTGSYRAKASQCVGAGATGACLGQVESKELGNAGAKYQSILGQFYTDPIGLVDISTGNFSVGVRQCISSGLELGTDGYYIRTTAPESTNIFFNQPYVNDSNRGQCVWYVKGRAQEIIANSIADASKKEAAKNAITATTGNGNQWFTEDLQKVFGSSTDYRLPKVGAIAVYTWTDSHCASYWGGTCKANYGHSLIVESVSGDTVTISQGYTKCSTGSPAWDCVKFDYSSHSISYMKDLGGNYKFIGYIYLLN